MNKDKSLVNLQIPTHVWIEAHSDDRDACDVIVEIEDGTIFTALFVTVAYIRRQMELTFDLCKQIPETVPVSFAAIDTSHIVVNSLDREIIEDTIDNLLALEVFESVFTQVTDQEQEPTISTMNGAGRRATQEVAAVVLSDVLVVEE